MEELAPHMRKFARLLKEIYQLDEVRYEDLKLEVDPTVVEGFLHNLEIIFS